MKFSIITPLWEPGNRYIEQTYDCLLKQTIKDWEWVIIENHGGHTPAVIKSDKRVSIYHSESSIIGDLKRNACELAKNELLVELDHDDLITPNTLELLLKAFENGADFVHSDSAEFIDGTWDKEWAHYPYGQVFGWEKYEVDYKGHKLWAMRAPEVNTHNLRLIDWSPNHVRAWTKDAYTKVGGHDRTMQVADDHDLMVRFFLAGMKFVHIPECLYMYRVHKHNTVKTKNSLIRALTQVVYNRNIWKLAEKYSNERKLDKIDLCGGINPYSDYEILDKTTGYDLNKDWLLKDNSVGILRAHDAIEHIRDPIHLMNEAYRVLAPGGFFMISVPSTGGYGAFCDPTHVSFWNKLSFRYYTDKNFSKFIPNYTGRFQQIHLSEGYPDKWHHDQNLLYVQSHMIALKDGYKPMGRVAI
jgi:O-antigen biosynthesis protein